MNNLQILDCTLRDGGYINNWNFGNRIIRRILRYLSDAHIDIIECGFLSDAEYDKDKSIFNHPSQIKNLITQNQSRHVAMIALGEKEIAYEKVPVCDESGVWGIRLTFHKHEIERAFIYANDLMSKGYQVFIQPVGTCTYTDRELLDLVDKVNALNPYAFYIVDTLGTITGTELMRLFQMIDANLNPKICIGFHSHNNLQLAFSNAQELVHHFTDRNVIVDASVQGMGRGAGNLCTELIAQYLNEKIHSSYNVIPLLEIVDKYLNTIKEQFPWGYTIPYYISAVNNCHPNYASFLMNKQTINVKDIKKILDRIPPEKRALFDKDYIQDLYANYLANTIKDDDIIKLLSSEFNNRTVLLIAPGKSIVSQKEQIQKFILDFNPIVISVNFIPEDYKIDYVFISNMKRFDDIDISNFATCDYKAIITSNIAGENKESLLCVNYSSYTNSDYLISDNAGLMSLALLKKCKISEVNLAGFDGFLPDSTQNYYSKALLNNVEYSTLENKTNQIREQIKLIRRDMVINFITKSQYED